jgi:3-hydroxyacyl-CoA dehydrogenase
VNSHVPSESQQNDSPRIESSVRESRPTIALIGATPTAELIAADALRAGLTVVIDDISDARLQATSINLHSIAPPPSIDLAVEKPLNSDVRAQHRCAPSPHDRSDSPESGSSSSGISQDQSASPQCALSSSLTSSAIPNLHLTQSIESAIRSADFLIDTLPDDLEVKLELFTLFDKFARPNAIFITTGSIPIDDLAAITFCPDRCLALGLTTTPTASAPTFHLIPAQQTSPQTLATCTALFLHTLAFHAK